MSKFWQKKYISKHTGAEIDEAVEAVLDGDVGTKVVANPTLAGTEPALTGLQVDETKYKVGGGMENPMTAAGDLIVGGVDGAPGRLGKGTDGQLLRMASGNLGYGNIPIITTAPEAANTDGIIICVLSSEPATKYNGYLYIITA